MSYQPPKRISITSDDSEVEFVKVVKGTPTLYEYKYIKGKEKEATTIKWSEDEIKKQLTNYWRIVG